MPQFESPLFLLLIPIGWALVAWGLRRRGHSGGRGGRRSLLVRLVALALLAAALANPTRPIPQPQPAAPLLLSDRSASVSVQALEEFDRSLPPLPGLQHLRVQDRPAEGTRLATALNRAAALLPEGDLHGGRMLLATDGQIADRAATLEAARRLGIPIDVVPLGSPGEVVLLDATVPDPILAGEPFDLYARLAADGPVGGTLRLVRADRPDDPPIGSTEFQYDPDRDEPQITLSDLRLDRGDHRLLLELTETGSTDRLENNRLELTVRVQGRTRTLFVTQDREPLEPILQAMARYSSGLRVEPELPVGGGPPIDLLVCDGAALENLSEPQVTFLRHYLTEGGGMVVLADDADPTADPRIASLLPVRFLPPVEPPKPELEPERPPKEEPEEKKEERRRIGLLLLIDVSGSMIESQWVHGRLVSKIEMARAAAVASAAALGPDDLIGIMTFSDQTEWLLNFARAGNKERIRVQTGALQANPLGGTDIYRALQRADEEFEQLGTGIKHIIVLSDGRNNKRKNFSTLAARIAARGVTLSAVGIGKEHDVITMRNIARHGRGVYDATRDFLAVPQLVVHQTKLQLEKRKPQDSDDPPPPKPPKPSRLDPTDDPTDDPAEPTDTPAEPAGEAHLTSPQPNNPFTRGIEQADWPTVASFRRTERQDGARVTLTVRESQPALADWYYGLGRVCVWTPHRSELQADRWSQWEKLPQLWSQILRATARRQEQLGPLAPTVKPLCDVELRRIGADRAFCQKIASETGGRLLTSAAAFEPGSPAVRIEKQSLRAWLLGAAVFCLPLELLFRRRQAAAPAGVPVT